LVVAGGGEFVTEVLDFDGGRPVTAYVPKHRVEAVVYAGDGEMISRWGAAIDDAGLRSTLVVGVHRHADEEARLHEYSPGFDPHRFSAHENFFVNDVRAWVDARFGVAPPPERTAIFGVSAGAELALAVGVRHADVYGAILGASPGAGFRPPAAMPQPIPRTYLVAGTGEPFFLANATRWATALQNAGADVVLTQRDGGHGDHFWQAEFPLMVEWAFGSA
jgi:enterochelin esterase-like enzyme